MRRRGRRVGAIKRRTCGVQKGYKTYPRKVIGRKGKRAGPHSKNSGVHYFRLKVDIDLSGADTAVKWAPAIVITNSYDLSKQYTFYKIHMVELKFVPKWSAMQPEDNNVKADDEVTNMWYRYLSWGAPDVNEPTVKDMENSRRAAMVGTKSFKCYDLSNADMRTSKSDDSNNTLAFERIKVDNHCWRRFKDGIPWYFMCFDFDNVISDDYYCYVVVHMYVKNYEKTHASTNQSSFPIKVCASVNGESVNNIGVYGQSGATRGGPIYYSEGQQ